MDETTETQHHESEIAGDDEVVEIVEVSGSSDRFGVEEIAVRAYEIYLSGVGDALDHWLQAERELQAAREGGAAFDDLHVNGGHEGHPVDSAALADAAEHLGDDAGSSDTPDAL